MFPRIVLARDRSRNNRDPNFVEVIRMEIRKGLSMGSTKLRQPVGLLGRCHSFGCLLSDNWHRCHVETTSNHRLELWAFGSWGLNVLLVKAQSLFRISGHLIHRALAPCFVMVWHLCFHLANPALKEPGRGKLEVVLFPILLNGIAAKRAVHSPQLTLDGLRKLLGKVRLDGREKAPHLHLLLLLFLVLLVPEMHHCTTHPPCTWHLRITSLVCTFNTLRPRVHCRHIRLRHGGLFRWRGILFI
mmetsp:Transcript_60135/g.131732  ORF Transcript_60135/g.131732 Transcript_60135/m.131732 type:complete len:244 (-) Transcript_60135:132-863(-)